MRTNEIGPNDFLGKFQEKRAHGRPEVGRASLLFHSSPAMKRKASSSINRPYKRPRPAIKRQPTVAALAKQVALNQNEKKYNDVTLNQDCNSTPVVTAVSTFGTGDTVLLRDGNKAIFKSFDIKVRITNSALTNSNVCRFVLVCDKLAQAEQCNWGTAASVADVFDAETITARRNILSAERFIVLMDEVIVLNELSGTGGATAKAYFHRYIKVPPTLQLVAWSGSSSTIPVKNAFSLLYLGDTASGISDCTIEGTVRVRWCDK